MRKQKVKPVSRFPLEQEQRSSQKRPDRVAVKAAERASAAMRQMLESDGWQKHVAPFMEKWIELATECVMKKADNGPEEQFLKGGAAAFIELREFIEDTVKREQAVKSHAARRPNVR